MKVTSQSLERFQLEPANLDQDESLLHVAAELRQWGYAVTTTAEDGLHYIVVEMDTGQEIRGTLTSGGVIEAIDWRLRELLQGLAAGYQAPNQTESGPVVARYGYFVMYQDGSYAGPPDYIGRGLADQVQITIESGQHEGYNRRVASGVEPGLAFLMCLHDDWGRLAGTEAASRALLVSGQLNQQVSGGKMQA